MNPETEVNLDLQAGQKHSMSFGDAKDQYQRNSNWWVVYAAFDLPDFVASPIWISQRTGIEVSEVVEALDGLTTLGFLKNENGAFYPVKDKDFVEFEWSKKSRGEIIEEHAIVSQQILNQLGESSAVIDHRCFSANKDIITELYQDIVKAFEKAYKKAKDNEDANDGIYKMSFTAVDVAPMNGKGE